MRLVVRDEADEESGTSWPSPSVLQVSIEMTKLNILPCQCSGNFADAATPMKLKPWPLPWYSPDSDTDRRTEAKLILNPTIEEATIMQLVMLWDELEEFQRSSCPRESESEPAFELRVENESFTEDVPYIESPPIRQSANPPMYVSRGPVLALH